MEGTGFSCPYCNGFDNEYIAGSTRIYCNVCHRVFDPGDDEELEDLACPRCTSRRIEIYDDDTFLCHECGLEGDVEDLEEI